MGRFPWGMAGAALVLMIALVPCEVRAQFVDDCGLEPPGTPLGPPVLPRPNELPFVSAGEPARVLRENHSRGQLLHSGAASPRLRTGALSGKTVYLSAGHGFYWEPALDLWLTQRGNTWGIVEDLVSTETISQYLMPLLINAGAYVVPLRESDPNPALVVVDDSDASSYSESGPAQTFSDSAVKGYGPPTLPLQNGTNVFELGGNRLMEATVGPTATASAEWHLTVPRDGEYNVYISYTQFSYRVPDAHFVVRHAGGEAHFRVNQRRHGSTWVLLGRFYFRAGSDPQHAAVVALNDSTETGNLSLDAVRIGGGMGMNQRLTSDGKPTPLSGRPRAEECARYHAQYMGAPQSVYDNPSLDNDHSDDVGARSKFAAWDHEPGEDAVYVAWHTNAYDTTVQGTETYVYGPNPPDGTYDFTGVAGSDLLAQSVHTELISDLRKSFDPNWKDRKVQSAFFGELNPNNNGETPAILIEVAFHDSQLDSARLKEPHFRYTAARAIAQGIIKYFAQKDGTAATLPPEPPVGVYARNFGSNTVEIGWSAAPTDGIDLGGDGATGFRLYSSADGFAWDDGTDVTGSSTTLVLPSGSVRYFRVSATNDGGESFPSEIVGVGLPESPGAPSVLVVNGYDRLDAELGQSEDLSKYTLKSVLRIDQEKMNDGSYARRHGLALADNRVAFDTATARAIESGAVALNGYEVVDWFAGRGIDADVAISTYDQQALRAFQEGGGRLIVSGSNVASALASGSMEDQAFLSDVLHAGMGSGSGSLSTVAVTGEVLDSFGPFMLEDGAAFGTYPVGAADVLMPVAGATAIAYWSDTHDIAALRTDAPDKSVFLSFPFESVYGERHRAELMGRLLTALDVPIDPVELPPDPDPDTEPDPDPDPSDAGTPMPAPEPIRVPAIGTEYPLADVGGCGCHGGGAGPIGFALLSVLTLVRTRKRG